MTVAGLVVAGALGSVLRYLVDRTVQRRLKGDFPLGILVVNVSGSLLLGFLTGAAVHHAVSAPWLTVAGTGLIGAYTTFSTFTFDTIRLTEGEQRTFALANVVVSLVAGVGAAAAGLALGALT